MKKVDYLPENQNGFAAFLGMFGMSFLIWWSPWVALVFKNIFSLQVFAIFWMVLVAVFMFQMGVNSSRNPKQGILKSVIEVFEEFISLGEFSTTSKMAFFCFFLPVFIVVFGSLFVYWTLFWQNILEDPVTYLLFIPLLHWLVPFFIGSALKNSSLFFVRMFRCI
ncbi:MAG: hypothetical protein K9M36_01915 [Candidatus Pacebacteria bacterium]|nr:hypothetical protein [Candidatus Paceibacterota bacterium]